MNVFAVAVILPLMGIFHLLKKVLGDVGKKVYIGAVAIIAAIILNHIFHFLK